MYHLVAETLGHGQMHKLLPVVHGMIYVLLLAGRMLVRERVWLFPFVSVRACGMLGHEKTQELLPFLMSDDGICRGLLGRVLGVKL